jgi:mannose/fructose/N-acetylgalactosamine-specific phosphotransferase system component IID/mannose/fructose/N-acetylgalactosamine-specific phosphotransferase system component IIC
MVLEGPKGFTGVKEYGGYTMPVWLKRGALASGALGLVGLLMLLMPTAVFAADAAPQEVSVSLFQAILIGLGYYLANSPWLFGMGFFTIYRPLAAGFFVGLIMGDPAQGTLIGAAINVAYLGFVSAGGSLPGDIALAGWLGTTLALAAHLNYQQALALAVPIGLLGTIVWYSRMTVDALFAHWADRYAEQGNIRMTGWMNVIPGQIFLFLIAFFPCMIAAYSGTKAAADLINAMPIWVLHGLTIGGGVFAAIGIAMNMRFIFRGAVIPYFFLGYFIMVASGKSLSIVVLAAVGLALAVLHVTFTQALKPAAEKAAAAAAPKAAVPDKGLRVTRGDLIKSWVLWTFFSHANYNYERLQATAFAQAMTPIISRLYTNPDDIKAALKRHLVFFNTEPNWGGVIHGIVIAMEEERANGATDIDDDAINSVKVGMMGPLAGIGDTIDQGTILPILLALGIGIAGVTVTAAGTDPTLGTGNPLGAIAFLVLAIAIFLPVTYLAYTQGYYRGREWVSDLLKSGIMDRIITGSTVLGNMVLGALTASFVTLYFAPTIVINATSLNIQTGILDKLLPGLNPLALVLISWYLLRRRVSPILLLVIFIVVALIGAYPFFGPAPQYFTDACGSALFQPYGPCVAK